MRLRGYEIERYEEKLFAGLIFFVLGIALFALRAFSEEERNFGLLMEQFPDRFFSLYFGIEFVHICFLQDDRPLS